MSKRSTSLREFRLTAQHLTLLQHMHVGWSDVEYGAPEIDPKRPYGESDVESSICAILGLAMVPDPASPGSWIFPPDARQAAVVLHQDMLYALQIVLGTQTFRPGLYRQTQTHDRRSWVLVGE